MVYAIYRKEPRAELWRLYSIEETSKDADAEVKGAKEYLDGKFWVVEFETADEAPSSLQEH